MYTKMIHSPSSLKRPAGDAIFPVDPYSGLYDQWNRESREKYSDGITAEMIPRVIKMAAGKYNFPHILPCIPMPSELYATAAFRTMVSDLKEIKPKAIIINDASIHSSITVDQSPSRLDIMMRPDDKEIATLDFSKLRIKRSVFYDWLRVLPDRFSGIGPIEIQLRGIVMNSKDARIILKQFTDNKQYQRLQPFPSASLTVYRAKDQSRTGELVLDRDAMAGVFGVIDRYRETPFLTFTVTSIPITFDYDSFYREKILIAGYDLCHNQLILNPEYFDENGKLIPGTAIEGFFG